MDPECCCWCQWSAIDQSTRMADFTAAAAISVCWLSLSLFRCRCFAVAVAVAVSLPLLLLFRCRWSNPCRHLCSLILLLLLLLPLMLNYADLILIDRLSMLLVSSLLSVSQSKRIGVPPLLRTELTTRLQHCCKHSLLFCLFILKLVGSIGNSQACGTDQFVVFLKLWMFWMGKPLPDLFFVTLLCNTPCYLLPAYCVAKEKGQVPIISHTSVERS